MDAPERRADRGEPLPHRERISGRSRHTGIETDAAWGSIITVRDGKILSAVGYSTPRQARHAAGLP